MSVPDRSIDDRLIKAAKKEFLKNGYEKTSLSGICRNAGVTTGALYKRYDGKEDLFSALVSGVIKEMEERVSEIIVADISVMTDEELYESITMKPEFILSFFKFLYERKDAFTILVKCSGGTKYENFRHKWAEKVNEQVWKYYEETKRRKMTSKKVSKEEMRVLTAILWEMFCEPFVYGFSWEQIEEHAKIFHGYINLHTALGIKKPDSKV